MKPSEVMPVRSDGGGTVFDRLEKMKRTASTKHDREAERDEELVFERAAVEVADDDPLHQHADHQQEQRTRDHRDDERPGRLVRDVTRITTEHEHRAVREVQHAERAVDDRQPGADERKQRAEREAVEELRDEIGPGDHDALVREDPETSLRAHAVSPSEAHRRQRSPPAARITSRQDQVYEPRLQPNASGFCISGSPGTISVTSQKSSLFFMSVGFLPRTMITGRTS